MKTARAGLRGGRALLGLLLLAFLLARLDLSEFSSRLRGTAAHWPWLLAGLLATLLGLLSGVLRWYRLLRAQGFQVARFQVFQISFIGQFFNAFMPGACGGDVVRVYYISRDTAKGSRAEAATTVLADRLIGLFLLMLFGGVIITLRLPFFLGTPQTRIAGLVMMAFLFAALGGSLLFFRVHVFEQWERFRTLEARYRFGAPLRRAYDALFQYKYAPGMIGEALGYSLLNMIFLTLACMCFGKSLGLTLPLHDYFTIFPLVTVLAAIPITPGALGIREGLFITLFGAVGAAYAEALSLSLLVYLGGVVCSLLGGLLFISYSSSSGTSLREEFHELKEFSRTPRHE